MTDFAARRHRMVERDVLGRGIEDPRVLAAMREVPRERFVPVKLRHRAYDDAPLPIGREQTISQPYIVALMAAALELDGRPGETVLDVGTGSGYAAAVLSHLADQVCTIERHAPLARAAEKRFAALGYDNIEVRHGDGALGWPERAPFDGIAVAAAAAEVPPALREQLTVGGRLVIPIRIPGRPDDQRLVRIVRTGPDRYGETSLGDVRFVPLLSGHRD